MRVVPVIDLMAGRVVHARRGDRSNYRPLESKLTRSSEPVAVVAALLALAPFDTLYVADRKNHLIRQLDLKAQTVKTIAGIGEQDRGNRGSGGPARVGD